MKARIRLLLPVGSGSWPDMARTMQEDLRSRVIAAVEGSLYWRAAAGFEASSAVWWLREWHDRADGS